MDEREGVDGDAEAGLRRVHHLLPRVRARPRADELAELGYRNYAIGKCPPAIRDSGKLSLCAQAMFFEDTDTQLTR